MDMDKKRVSLLSTLAAVFILLMSSVIAYIENIEYPEALYRIVYISLTRADIFRMDSWPARFMVLTVILASFMLVAYLLKLFGEYIIGLGDGLKRSKVKTKLLSIKDHYIVCGLGRVGSQVARELASEGRSFVAIDRDEDRVREAVARGYTAFVGDSTKEEVLSKAKIEKATGLVASLGDDSSNLFVTLTSRQINPSLFIVARANREENITRMTRAGADRVAMPNQIGGFHMATMLVRPHVVDVLDMLSTNRSSDLQVQEINIPKGSGVSGHRLEGLLKHIDGISVLALNSAGGTSQVHPTGKEVLYPGDRMVVMGTSAQIQSLEKIV